MLLNYFYEMDNRLDYSYVYSDLTRDTMFKIVHYCTKLCKRNNIPLDMVPAVVYQLNRALADGKIVMSDIETDKSGIITNITSINIESNGKIICSY